MNKRAGFAAIVAVGGLAAIAVSQTGILINPKAVSPSADLAGYSGLMCRVYLRTDFNPHVGLSNWSSGTSVAGLLTVDGIPVSVEGKLTAVSKEGISVTGQNGHTWVPRDQIKAVEVVQNPPSTQ